jgi:uncharacterized repeat protein (TIGR01451 family)
MNFGLTGRVKLFFMRITAKLRVITSKTLDKLFSNNKAVLAVVGGILVGFSMLALIVYLYHPEGPKAKAAISQILGVQIYDTDNQPVNDRTVAKPEETLEWRKQIEVGPGDINAQTTTIEKIPETQNYQAGSVKLPPGWIVKYSTTEVESPEEDDFNWQDDEPDPASSVTYLKISTETVNTTKPVAQTIINRPLDQEEFDAPDNPKVLLAHKYESRLYTVYRAVDVSNGTNDETEVTINCYDLAQFNACEDTGVNFPAYLSSEPDTKFGGKMSDGITDTPKDISTPHAVKEAFDDGTYGHEGYLYIVAQQGDNYGVNCIDLKNAKNCGFTDFGSSDAPSQEADLNPTLISGFAQSGSKLYAHANYDNGNADVNDDYMDIICFDMSTLDKCTGYESKVATTIPSLMQSEHSSHFFTTSQHLMDGDKYFFIVSYDEDNPILSNNSKYSNKVAPMTAGEYTQTMFGTVIVCYDVALKDTCSGWPSRNIEYNYKFNNPACGAICGLAYDRQAVKGALIVQSNTAYANEFYERPHQLMFARNDQNAITGLCVYVGLHAVSGTTTAKCYEIADGASNIALKPNNFVNGSWIGGPWVPNFEATEIDGKLYSSWDLPGPINADGSYKTRSATLCYDWELQDMCDTFRKPHYWYEVEEMDARIVEYISDGECVIAISALDYAWSFDKDTGETPCRRVNDTVQIDPSGSMNDMFCDGGEHVFQWSDLRLNKVNMYDLRNAYVTVKDENGDVVGGFDNVDLKTWPGNKLDISSIPFSGSTDTLEIDFKTEIFNTSPWSKYNSQTDSVDISYPYVSAVLSGDPAQYCYKTKIKPHCDIDSAETISNITSETDDDILEDENPADIGVTQLPEVQCFRDLKVSVVADKTEVGVGDTLTYTIDVENQANIDDDGRGNISGAGARVVIPSGASLVSATGGYSKSGNTLTWPNTHTVLAEQKFQKRVTLKIDPIVSQSADATKAYAAESLVLRAVALYDDEYDDTDNTIDFAGVTLLDGGIGGDDGGGEEEPGGDDGGGEEEPGGETPVIDTGPTYDELPGVERESANNGGSAGSRSFTEELTPGFIRSILPPTLKNTVENAFQLVNSAVAPISPGVAAAIPYSAIAFLIAFALIYIYQALQEARSRRKMLGLFKRYKRTEDIRKNYVDLTSHYLNTPIATMKSSVELMQSKNLLPATIAQTAKLRLQHLIEHSQVLLSKTSNVNSEATSMSNVLAPINKKPRLFSRGVVLPILGVLLITVLINAVFVWADKYSANTFMLAVQSSYYVLSVFALVMAYNTFRNQRYATKLAEQELALESQLADSQTAFIANTSRTLEDDVVELNEVASKVAKVSHGQTFVTGLNSLKNAILKLNYLNTLTNHKVNQTIPDQTIKDLTEEVITNLKPFADRNSVLLNTIIEPGLTANVDIDGFRQILSSVLHNAIKFNKPDGTVDLSIKRKNDKYIEIIIKDNGSGIAKDKIDQIFTPFGRATDTRTYNFEGFGLDLYMDKLIADQSGGTIQISSEEGVGTTVSITLPS